MHAPTTFLRIPLLTLLLFSPNFIYIYVAACISQLPSSSLPLLQLSTMAEKVTTMTFEVIDLQCHSCSKKVKKILCKFPEIRDQVYDEKKNLVKITVVSPNPEKIRDKLYCKGGKVIKCIKIEVPKPPPPPPPPPAPAPEPCKKKCKRPCECEKKCKPLHCECEKKCKPPCEKKCKPLDCECEKKCKPSCEKKCKPPCEKKCKPPPSPCCCCYCRGTSTNVNVEVTNVGVNNPYDIYIEERCRIM